MKAKIENIIAKDRVDLGEAIPLNTPFSVVIDPCNLCNLRCEFCAMHSTSKKLNFKKQMMDYQLYQKIIDDLREFEEPVKVLRIIGQGEPLLNPDFCRMVAYAKERHVADLIETVTNGTRFEPELNQRVVDSGIGRIRISIEALDDEGYYRIAKKKVNVRRLVENLTDLYEKSRGKCEIYIKIVDAAVETEELKEKFYQMFGNICDRIWIDRIIPLWSDFKEVEERFDISADRGLHGQQVVPVEVCPFPFYSLFINSDGQVTVCCADWERKLVVGDLRESSLKEIWNGEILWKFWKDLLLKKRSDYEMCRKCVLPSYDCNDNIDEYAEQIYKNIERAERIKNEERK